MRKKLLIAISILITIAVAYFYLSNKQNSKELSKSNLTPNTDFSGESNPDVKTLEGDMLGLGTKQKVQVSVGEKKVKIEVINDGKVVADNVFDDGWVKPTSNYSLIKLDDEKNKEYLRWDQYVGPHETETHILTAKDNIIRPILAADYENKQWYAPFWSSRDNTYIGDIDGDGVSEIIEYVDEFPPDAPRLEDKEIEKITRNEFPDNIEDDMWNIVSRENNGLGRGRKVIWNVYTLIGDDPEMFQKANKEDYERLTTDIFKAMSLVNETNPGTTEIVSRYQLSQDSIDFNNFVRDFWTQGMPYSQPFDENRN